MQCIEGCLLYIPKYEIEAAVAGYVDTKVCKRSCQWQVLCMDMEKGGK